MVLPHRMQAGKRAVACLGDRSAALGTSHRNFKAVKSKIKGARMNRLVRVALVLLLPYLMAMTCEKGCYVYEGVCACDQSPETAQPVKPSDEKPPKDKMPSYQREGVVVDMPKSQSTEEEDAARRREDAKFLGKRAARIELIRSLGNEKRRPVQRR